MNETFLRLSVFAGAFLLLATLEAFAPKRGAALSRIERWPGAATLLIISSILGRLILPVGLAGVALWAQTNGIGLFNLWNAPAAVSFLATIIALDFAVWLQHVLIHRIDPLWRLHRVHHSDPHLDVTTALRFHPAEILFSLVWKGAFVALLGAPASAVLAFEILLNASAQFNHANIALPGWLDRILRLLIVTPDMHRVHHSIDHQESNRNFGFFLSVWDRLFGLYQSQPSDGHRSMTIGQLQWREAADQTPGKLILQPFSEDTHSVIANR